MARFLDLDTWYRRVQYDFFRRYELPFFGVTAEVDATALRAACRAAEASFSLAVWYAVYRAANAVEPLRYRLRGDRVWVHDEVRIATTVDTGPETFAFAYLPAAKDFPAFTRAAAGVIAAARERPGETMDDRPEDDGVIHGTVLPWVRFTAITHARRLGTDGSVPKVALGRAVDGADGRTAMPVSIEAHHALLDGVHVGRFYAELQALLDVPDWIAPGEGAR